MSGIKDEDFKFSNFSPLFNINVGKWYSEYIALQVGYKGFYFKYIMDERKHYYNYFYSGVAVNLFPFIIPCKINKNVNIYLHAGAGYFYKYDYDKSNICSNSGIQMNYKIQEKFLINFNPSSIIGWDIYQGNWDILTGVTIGVTYFL